MRLTMKKRSILVLAACLAATAPAMAASPSATFEAGSVRVEQYGSGSPALVLIPGLTDSGRVWDATVAHYAGSHTVYVLTLPGFGGRPAVAAPMIDAVVRDVGAFLPRANKPVVIGHSLGGFIAIRLAEQYGSLISGAVSVDGLPVFEGMDTLPADTRNAIADKAAAQIGASSPSQFQAAQKQQLAYMTKPANVDAAMTFSQGADIAATAEYLREMLPADIRPDLSKVSVPLLLMGPFDSAVDPQNPYVPTATLAAKQAYYAKLISGDPKAKVVMIDNSRHFIMLDQPVAFYAALDAFLASV